MNDLCLVPIGSVPAKALDWIENATAEWLPLPIRRLPALAIPESAYDSKRNQGTAFTVTLPLKSRNTTAEAREVQVQSV